MLKRKEIPQQAFEKEKQERRRGEDSKQKGKSHKLMKTLHPLQHRWTQKQLQTWGPHPADITEPKMVSLLTAL